MRGAVVLVIEALALESSSINFTSKIFFSKEIMLMKMKPYL